MTLRELFNEKKKLEHNIFGIKFIFRVMIKTKAHFGIYVEYYSELSSLEEHYHIDPDIRLKSSVADDLNMFDYEDDKYSMSFMLEKK